MSKSTKGQVNQNTIWMWHKDYEAKNIITIIFLFFLISPVNGYTVGNGGNSWGGNSTLENTSTNLASRVIITNYIFQDDFESVLFNNRTYLTIPTVDGSGQAIHPDIYYNATGWNGYKYWMVFTPYPNSNDALENPHIVVSDDGFNWKVPSGLSNPIDPPPGLPLMNSDPNFAFKNGTLYGFYRESNALGGGFDRLKMRNSSDGTNWSNEYSSIELSNYHLVAPAIIYNSTDDKFYMWYVDRGNITTTWVLLRNSSDGINWGSTQNVSITIPNRVIWHVNVEYIPEVNEYWMVISAGTTGTITKNELFFAYSTDKLNWTVLPGKVIGLGRNWDNDQIYQSALQYINNTVKIWYSAKNSTNVWATGYAETSLLDLKKNYHWVYQKPYDKGYFTQSNEQVKYGRYSGKINSDTSSGAINIVRNVTNKQDVVFETWLYDDGDTSAMKLFRVMNSSEKLVGVGVWTGSNTTNYVIHSTAYAYTATTVTRTNGWHQFKIFVKSDKSVEYYIDNSKVGTMSLQFNDPINATLSSGTGQITTFYVDNLKVYTYTTGNLTTWYDAGIGKETYQIDVNANTPANTNYSVFYRSNGTGSFTHLADYTGNNSIALSTSYQNTDVQIVLNGNKTATPELISIAFYTRTAGGGTPPSIISWMNSKTNNNIQSLNLTMNEVVNFKVTSDQPITTWSWFVDGINQFRNFDNFTTSWSRVGAKSVSVIAANSNGSSNMITWNVFVQNPPAVLPKISKTAPYANIPTQGAANWGGLDREFIQAGHNDRIRQNGTIYQIRFAVKDASNLTQFNFTVWRENGSNYDRVATTNNLINNISKGMNVINLSPPIEGIREGDFYGYRIRASIQDPLFVNTLDTKHLTYYIGGATSYTNYNWSANPSDSYVFVIEPYMESPYMVFIGDSIISGVPAHVSFIQYQNFTNISSSIENQWSIKVNKTYQNMGIAGDTTTGINSRFNSDVVDLSPEFVLIEGGINDVNSGESNEIILANWESMIQKAYNKKITPVIMLILPDSRKPDTTLSRITYINDQLIKMAANYSPSIVVDARCYIGVERPSGQAGNCWNINTSYTMDGLHYNSAGNERIAQAIKYSFRFVHGKQGLYNLIQPDGTITYTANLSNSINTSWRMASTQGGANVSYNVPSSGDLAILTINSGTIDWFSINNLSSNPVCSLYSNGVQIESKQAVNNSVNFTNDVSSGTYNAQCTVAPNIIMWRNNKTNNEDLSLSISINEFVNFYAAADQTITTWSWFIDGIDQSRNSDDLSMSRTTAGTRTVKVNAINSNGASNTITWTVTVKDPSVYMIGGSGNAWAGNSTTDYATEDNGNHNIKIGIFADNFEDNNLNGWTTTGGTHTVSNGIYKQQTDAVEWISARPATFFYYSPAVILAKVNVADGGSFLDEGLGWGGSTWNSGINIFAGRRDAWNQWELRKNDILDGSNVASRTLNVWSNLQLYKKSNSYNYSSSYNNVLISTSNSPTNSQYPYLLGSSQIIQFWDDVRIVPLDPNNNLVTKGNLTTWFDAGSGKETYQIDVNATTPANTNYTVWYRQNGTGIFMQLGDVKIGNRTIALSTSYQNTDVRIVLNGDQSATPEIISIKFVAETPSNTPDTNTIPSITGIQNGSVGDTWSIVNFTVNQSNAFTHIKYSKNSDLSGASNTLNQSSGTDRSEKIIGLIDGTKYYYSVYAWNSSNTSLWTKSSIYDFSTVIPIFITITSPTNNSVNNTGFINITVTLNRNGNTTLNWDGSNESMMGSGTHLYKNKNELLSGTYSFRVYANDSNGVFSASETRIVTVNRTIINTTIGNFINTSTFIVNRTLEITSPSGNTTLIIPNGTNASFAGAKLTSISIDSVSKINSTFAALGGNDKFIGENVTFGPSGAVFDPPIQIRFNYTDAQLTAAGISESDLSVKYYNTTLNNWEPLTIVQRNPAENYFMTNISHFSTVALIGTTATATTQPPSSGGGGSRSGGGGGGGTSGETFTNIIVKERYDLYIYKDTVTSYKFTNINNPILSINIVGNVNAGEIGTSVEVLRNTSSLVKIPAPGNVYKNVNIWVGTSGFGTSNKIKEAVTTFRVDNSWIRTNNIKSSSITMVRWNSSKWDKLETSEITKDGRYTYYDSKTNAFSSFAITGMEKIESISENAVIIESNKSAAAIQSDGKTPDFLTNWFMIIGVLFAIGIIIKIYLRIKRK